MVEFFHTVCPALSQARFATNVCHLHEIQLQTRLSWSADVHLQGTQQKARRVTTRIQREGLIWKGSLYTEECNGLLTTVTSLHMFVNVSLGAEELLQHYVLDTMQGWSHREKHTSET